MEQRCGGDGDGGGSDVGDGDDDGDGGNGGDGGSDGGGDDDAGSGGDGSEAGLEALPLSQIIIVLSSPRVQRHLETAIPIDKNWLS